MNENGQVNLEGSLFVLKTKDSLITSHSNGQEIDLNSASVNSQISGIKLIDLNCKPVNDISTEQLINSQPLPCSLVNGVSTKQLVHLQPSSSLVNGVCTEKLVDPYSEPSCSPVNSVSTERFVNLQPELFSSPVNGVSTEEFLNLQQDSSSSPVNFVSTEHFVNLQKESNSLDKPVVTENTPYSPNYSPSPSESFETDSLNSGQPQVIAMATSWSSDLGILDSGVNSIPSQRVIGSSSQSNGITKASSEGNLLDLSLDGSDKVSSFRTSSPIALGNVNLNDSNSKENANTTHDSLDTPLVYNSIIKDRDVSGSPVFGKQSYRYISSPRDLVKSPEPESSSRRSSMSGSRLSLYEKDLLSTERKLSQVECSYEKSKQREFELQHDVLTSHKKATKLQQELVSANKKVARLESQSEEMQTKKGELQRELFDACKKLSRLEASCQSYQDREASLQKEILTYHQRTTQLELEVLAASRKISKLEASSETVERQKRNNQQELYTAQEKLSHLQAKFDSANSQKPGRFVDGGDSMMRIRVTELEAKADSARKENNELNKDLSQARGKIVDLEGRLNAVLSEKAALLGKLGENSASEKYMEELLKLQQQFEDYKGLYLTATQRKEEETTNMHKQVKDYKDQYDQAKRDGEKLGQLRAELQQEKDKCRKFETKCSELMKEVEETRQNRAFTDTENEVTYEGLYDQIDKYRELYEKECVKRSGEVEYLQEQLEEQRNRYDKLSVRSQREAREVQDETKKYKGMYEKVLRDSEDQVQKLQRQLNENSSKQKTKYGGEFSDLQRQVSEWKEKHNKINQTYLDETQKMEKQIREERKARETVEKAHYEEVQKLNKLIKEIQDSFNKDKGKIDEEKSQMHRNLLRKQEESVHLEKELTEVRELYEKSKKESDEERLKLRRQLGELQDHDDISKKENERELLWFKKRLEDQKEMLDSTVKRHQDKTAHLEKQLKDCRDLYESTKQRHEEERAQLQKQAQEGQKNVTVTKKSYEEELDKLSQQLAQQKSLFEKSHFGTQEEIVYLQKELEEYRGLYDKTRKERDQENISLMNQLDEYKRLYEIANERSQEEGKTMNKQVLEYKTLYEDAMMRNEEDEMKFKKEVKEYKDLYNNSVASYSEETEKLKSKLQEYKDLHELACKKKEDESWVFQKQLQDHKEQLDVKVKKSGDEIAKLKRETDEYKRLYEQTSMKYEEDVEKLKKQLKEHKLDHENSVFRVKDDVEKLQVRVDEYKKLYEDACRQKDDSTWVLEKQLQDTKQRYESSSEKQKEKVKDLEGLLEQYKNLYDQVCKEKQDDTVRHEKELAELRDSHEQYQNKHLGDLFSLQKQLEDYKALCENMKDEKHEETYTTQEQIQVLKFQNEKMKSESDNQKQMIKNLKSEKEFMDTELQALKLSHSKTRDNNDKRDRLNRKLSDQLEELQEKMKKLQESNHTYSIQNIELQQQATSYQTSIEELESAFENVSKDKELLQQKMQQAETVMEQLQRSSEMQSRESNTLREDLMLFQKKASNLEVAFNSVEHENEQLKEENKELAQRTEMMEEEADRLRSELWRKQGDGEPKPASYRRGNFKVGTDKSAARPAAKQDGQDRTTGWGSSPYGSRDSLTQPYSVDSSLSSSRENLDISASKTNLNEEPRESEIKGVKSSVENLNSSFGGNSSFGLEDSQTSQNYSDDKSFLARRPSGGLEGIKPRPFKRDSPIQNSFKFRSFELDDSFENTSSTAQPSSEVRKITSPWQTEEMASDLKGSVGNVKKLWETESKDTQSKWSNDSPKDRTTASSTSPGKLSTDSLSTYRTEETSENVYNEKVNVTKFSRQSSNRISEGGESVETTTSVDTEEIENILPSVKNMKQMWEGGSPTAAPRSYIGIKRSVEDIPTTVQRDSVSKEVSGNIIGGKKTETVSEVLASSRVPSAALTDEKGAQSLKELRKLYSEENVNNEGGLSSSGKQFGSRTQLGDSDGDKELSSVPLSNKTYPLVTRRFSDSIYSEPEKDVLTENENVDGTPVRVRNMKNFWEVSTQPSVGDTRKGLQTGSVSPYSPAPSPAGKSPFGSSLSLQSSQENLSFQGYKSSKREAISPSMSSVDADNRNQEMLNVSQKSDDKSEQTAALVKVNPNDILSQSDAYPSISNMRKMWEKDAKPPKGPSPSRQISVQKNSSPQEEHTSSSRLYGTPSRQQGQRDPGLYGTETPLSRQQEDKGPSSGHYGETLSRHESTTQLITEDASETINEEEELSRSALVTNMLAAWNQKSR